MKAYTDLEQSKKLAKILPLKSADMYYHKNTKGDFVEYPHFNAEYKSMVDRDINYNDEVIPCWSLAALLGVLPKSLMCTPNPTLDGYCCKNIMHDLETYGSNPIDACYEMILKLNELNLL